MINLACSLGRLEPERRRLELETACGRAEFELIVHPPPLRISSGDDLAAAQRALAATVGRLIVERRVDVVVSPSPHDGHHGHEMVGRAARDAVCAAPALGPRLWMWGLSAVVPASPNAACGYDDERMARAIHVLEAHKGELERNDYRLVVRGRAAANRALGPSACSAGALGPAPRPNAELLTEVTWRNGEWWASSARELDPKVPLADDDRAPVRLGWWMDSPSFADRLRQEGTRLRARRSAAPAASRLRPGLGVRRRSGRGWPCFEPRAGGRADLIVRPAAPGHLCDLVFFTEPVTFSGVPLVRALGHRQVRRAALRRRRIARQPGAGRRAEPGVGGIARVGHAVEAELPRVDRAIDVDRARQLRTRQVVRAVDLQWGHGSP